MTTYITRNTILDKQANRNGVPNGSRDLFHFLRKAQPSAKIRTTTEGLLKSAYKMLEKSEKEIKEKDKRIKALENIITTDEMTGLTNRRGFYKSFKSELERTNRNNSKGGILIMIDLDHFKSINDTFGHIAGDEALKTVGKFLTGTIREMDIAARIGGDEFITLFSDTSIHQAMERVKSLGEELNNLSFKWDGSTINIHASLGVKEYKQGDTIEGIINSADKRMYKDKENKKHTKH